MIYIDDHIDDFDLTAALAAVSPERRAYALRYRHERDQRLCVAAFLLLKRALSIEFDMNEVPPIIRETNGKPYLEGHPEIHFNLSHCNMAVACAVGTSPTGIDVESLDRYDPEVASATMSDEECARIVASQSPEVEFTRLWTMKESLYKLTGDDHGGDIAQMLDNASRYRFTTTVHSSYLCTVCSPKQS